MTAAGDLPRADPMPRMLAWLNTHLAVAEALGGPDRVDANNQPPYPRVRVLDVPGSDLRDPIWLLTQEVQLKAYGDLDGRPGKQQLRRIAYTVLGALTELPDKVPLAGDPIITAVKLLRSPGWVPEPTGQPCYDWAVRVYSHPPAP